MAFVNSISLASSARAFYQSYMTADARMRVISAVDPLHRQSPSWAVAPSGAAKAAGEPNSIGPVPFYPPQVGYYFDDDLSRHHVRTREYDPDVGRWISEDPMGLSSGDAQQESCLYRYVDNDPLNRSDPSGLTDPDNQIVAFSSEVLNDGRKVLIPLTASGKRLRPIDEIEWERIMAKAARKAELQQRLKNGPTLSAASPRTPGQIVADRLYYAERELDWAFAQENANDERARKIRMKLYARRGTMFSSFSKYSAPRQDIQELFETLGMLPFAEIAIPILVGNAGLYAAHGEYAGGRINRCRGSTSCCSQDR